MKINDEDIDNALIKHEGNRVKASIELGIGLRTLRYKIRRSQKLLKKYPTDIKESSDVREEDLPDDLRGRFRDYWEDVVKQKPGYHFANDKKRVRIHQQVLQEFVAGKVRDYEHFQRVFREDSVSDD